LINSLREDKIMSLAERIKEVRKTAGLSLAELAKQLGLSSSAVLKYEKDQSVPPVGKLAKIAEIGNVTLDWLWKGNHIGTQKKSTSDLDEFYFIPRYDVNAAAGHGAFNDTENIIQYMAFRKEYINSYLRSSKIDLFIITAIGDSMTPVIHTGDVLLADKRKGSQLGEGIYILKIDGTLLVKNVQRLPGGNLKIYSTNAQYSPITVAVDDPNVEIIAKVVWIGKSLE